MKMENCSRYSCKNLQALMVALCSHAFSLWRSLDESAHYIYLIPPCSFLESSLVVNA